MPCNTNFVEKLLFFFQARLPYQVEKRKREMCEAEVGMSEEGVC